MGEPDLDGAEGRGAEQDVGVDGGGCRSRWPLGEQLLCKRAGWWAGG